MLAICGSRNYVFFLDAAPTERLVSQQGSLLTYLEEEDDLQTEGGGKLRKSILVGAGSDPCMAAVRAMAIVCDAVLWQLLRAVKPAANVHVLDVLTVVWPTAIQFFKAASETPASVVECSLQLDLSCVSPGSPGSVEAAITQNTRSERAQLDMRRIRRRAQGDALVERLLAAAFTAMCKATANHAAEWLYPPVGRRPMDP